MYGCEAWSLISKEEHRLREFENRVLKKIFGPKSNGVTWEWRRLHNEELYDQYSVQDIIRVIKTRIIRWTWEIPRIGRRKVHTEFRWEDLRKGGHLEDPAVDERTILNGIFKN